MKQPDVEKCPTGQSTTCHANATLTRAMPVQSIGNADKATKWPAKAETETGFVGPP